MQKQKLLKLAKGLRSLTRAESRHFDMDCFIEHYNDDSNFKDPNWTKLPRDITKLNDCGTAACALGWAPTFFPRSKLKLGKCGDVIYGEEFTGFEAGEKMFNITHEQSVYLFDPCSYLNNVSLTPKYVAKRIEKFVETNGKNCEQYFKELDENI